MRRLVLLGSKGGPALRPQGARPTSTLLQWGGLNVLVDAGLGCSLGVVEAGVALSELDVVVITHLHADHVLELGPLLHTAWTSGLTRPIRVIAPAGAEHLWRYFLKSMAVDIELRVVDEGRTPLTELVRFEAIAAGERRALSDDLSLRTLAVPHPPVEPNLALRFDGPTAAITFSGDTAYHPPLARFAHGSRVLLHEAMLPEALERLVARTHGGERLYRHLVRSHSSVEEAARIAAAAEARALVLHHLIPADDPQVTRDAFEERARQHFGGRVIVASDGLSLDLDTL